MVYLHFDQLLDEIDTLKTRVDVMQGELNRRQETIEWLRDALRIIAGEMQCADNLLSHSDVARWALSKSKYPIDLLPEFRS